MEMQNITLSIPKSTLRKIKLIAVQRETSVSKLITEAVEKIAREDDKYNQAMEEALSMMKQGFHIGFKKSASRDELHDRRY
jgi:metal-responsive CopG/Arc/MetJ family transcriptional regulator